MIKFNRDNIIKKISSKIRKFFIKHKISPWFDEYYAKYIAVKRRYQAKNATRLKLYNQEYHRKHSKEISERKRRWYLENQDKVRESQRVWRAKNPDKVRAYWEKAWLKKKADGDKNENQERF